jgi:hypothetical protein
MLTQQGSVLLGTAAVCTTDGRDYTPQEWADLATNKVISIGDTSHPVIQAQARAFQTRIREVIASTVQQAIEADRKFRG